MSLNRKILSVFIVLFLVFNDALSYYIGPLSYFDELLVVFCGLLFLAHVVQEKKIGFLLLLVLVLVFSLTGLISFYLNSLHLGTISNTLLSNFQMIKVFLLIFFVANLSISLNLLNYFVYGLKFVGAFNGIFMILQFLFYSKWTIFFPYQFISETTRFFGIAGLQGLYYFPGVSGSVYLFTAIICYVQLKKMWSSKVFFEFLMFSLFAMLSMRAKIFIAFAIIIFIVEICLPDSKNRISKMIIGSIPIIGGVAVILPFIYNQVAMYFNPVNNTTARYLLQVNAKYLAQTYSPFGVGFGEFASEGAKNNYSQWYYSLGLSNVWGLTPDSPGFATDTWWPAILGETGYFGFGIYVLMLVIIMFVLYNCYAGAIKRKDILLQMYSLISLLITIQLIIESSAYQVFVTSPQFVIWGIFTGVVLGQSVYVQKKGELCPKH
ncbi:hypothetical protein J3330_09635 [Leuconostoc mesenteroides]|uniref:hypothetical protein n=1 Tax=Leuconostoc mesenteroides TaxID=1245 RepID=UPI001CBC8C89|nr:hypothetical protein [Leuconostoc mesenteroides]MBZ1519353.1 hypothetical protein [Leuconostoc mesenteroides]MBZ1521627.1 hypothetical protein [Leuconostoc mesenteroides]MBZ1523906.1 hypothetical protein [Leuconostoc mesenteroides]